jgi:hypothetical protein
MTQYEYSEEQEVMLKKLIGIVESLYLETAGFLENGDNQQHWYNRGYANGIVKQLSDLGYRDYVENNTVPDAEDIIAGHEFWAWGKAYQHGFEVGMKETTDVMGPRQL